MTKMDPQVQRSASSTVVSGNRRLALHVFSLTLIILGISAGYGYSRFGSLAAALSATQGDSLLVDQRLKSVDGIRPGSRVALRYALTNASGRPIKLIGMSSTCSCTVMEDLPMTLAVSETRSVTAMIRTREGESVLDGSIRLYTDDPRSAEIVLGYSLRLTPRSHHPQDPNREG